MLMKIATKIDSVESLKKSSSNVLSTEVQSQTPSRYGLRVTNSLIKSLSNMSHIQAI